MRLRNRIAPLVVAALVVTACAGMESFGPWVNADGQVMQASQVIQFRGFAACGQQKVVFLQFFGDQYAEDPEGVLGPLHGKDGRLLTFAILDAVPPGAEPTGIHHDGREIYVDPATRSDYVYIVYANGRVERWPRAEIACDGSARIPG